LNDALIQRRTGDQYTPRSFLRRADGDPILRLHSGQNDEVMFVERLGLVVADVYRAVKD
jgi:hypothetical protein